MTAVTGLVDAVSFLYLGHVFTANMSGNIVLLAIASTGVPQVSLARSITALLGFLAGAAVGGRIMAGASAVVAASCGEFGFCIGDCFLSRGNSGRAGAIVPFPLRFSYSFTR